MNWNFTLNSSRDSFVSVYQTFFQFFQSVQCLPACLHQKTHLELQLWLTRNLHKHIRSPTPSGLVLKPEVNIYLWWDPGLLIYHSELLSFRWFRRFKLNGKCILYQTKTFHLSLSQYLSWKKLVENQIGFNYTFAMQCFQYNHTRLDGSRVQTKRDTYSAISCVSQPVCHLLRRDTFPLL